NTRVEKLGTKHAFISLGHELIHALRITSGVATAAEKQASFNNVFKRPSDGKMVLESVTEEEFFTVGLPDALKKAAEYNKVPSGIRGCEQSRGKPLGARARFSHRGQRTKQEGGGGPSPPQRPKTGPQTPPPPTAASPRMPSPAPRAGPAASAAPPRAVA